MGKLSEFYRLLPMLDVLANVETRDGTSKAGKPYKSRTQVAYLVQVDEYGQETRRRVRVPLENDQVPYPVGMATVEGISFNGNQWGDLELQRFGLRLLPVPQAVWDMVQADAKVESSVKIGGFGKGAAA